MSDLASVIIGNPDDVVRIPQLRQGIVTQVSPLMVQVGAATSSQACRTLGSYPATVGETVSVLVIQGDRLVLGSATGNPSSPGPAAAYYNRDHPTFSGASLWPVAWGAAPGGEYTLLSQGPTTYLGAQTGGDIHFRHGNVEIASTSGGNLCVHATRALHFVDYGGGWFMQDTTWIRAVNNKYIYTGGEIRTGGRFSFDNAGYVFTHQTDTDTGIYYDTDGHFRLMANGTSPLTVYPGGLAINQGQFRLFSETDGNHLLCYSEATPSGSGSPNSGPLLQGYGSVWLHTALGDGNFFLTSDGYTFINTSGAYLKFSSREFKENVVTLDPAACLDQVVRWRPVEFDYIGRDGHGEGFIAEEMAEVTPSAVHVTGPDNERPGWANAMAYSSLTVQLAGAVQALLGRIDQISARLDNLETP